MTPYHISITMTMTTTSLQVLRREPLCYCYQVFLSMYAENASNSVSLRAMYMHMHMCMNLFPQYCPSLNPHIHIYIYMCMSHILCIRLYIAHHLPSPSPPNSSMKRCRTEKYERDAFASDQYRDNTLQFLSLSGNNLTVLGRRGFRYLDDLIELYVN